MWRKKINKWTIFLAIILVLPFSSYAMFGDSMALIPYLRQQIVTLRSQLRTANETLGYFKGMQRGFNYVRHYRMSDARNDYLLNDPDYLGIKQELYTTREGGDYTDIRINDLDRQIRKIYKPKSERTVPEARRSLFASNLAHKNMKTSMLMKTKTSRNLHQDGRKLTKESVQSLSPSQSQKLTAEGVGLMVQSQADQMLLLSNLNQNSSADLQIQAAQEKEEIESSAMDRKTLLNIKKSVRPIR